MATPRAKATRKGRAAIQPPAPPQALEGKRPRPGMETVTFNATLTRETIMWLRREALALGSARYYASAVIAMALRVYFDGKPHAPPPVPALPLVAPAGERPHYLSIGLPPGLFALLEQRAARSGPTREARAYVIVAALKCYFGLRDDAPQESPP